MAPTTEDAFERSARRWLRAYPPSWRARHGAEVVSVLADLAEPSARRVDARTAAGLVVGGLRTRWRTGPPLHARLAFWVFDNPPAARYEEWLLDAVSARRFRVTRWLRGCLPVLVVLSVRDVREDALSLLAIVAPVVVLYSLVVLLTNGERTRRTALQRFYASRGPRLDPALRPHVVLVPRQRLAAVPGTAVAVVLVGTGAVAWSVAGWLVPAVTAWRACPVDGPGVVACTESVVEPRASSTGWLIALAVAAVVGALVAAGAWRRLRRLLPALPEQPSRELVPLVRTAPAGVALLVATIVGSAVWEVTRVGVLSVLAVGAPVCVALLPLTLVLLRAAHRAPRGRGLAAVDLWTVAFLGRGTRPDETQPTVGAPFPSR